MTLHDVARVRFGRENTYRVLIATSLLFVIQGPLLAADTAKPSDDALEEIVVTAARRSELVQDVPISVTAVTGSALADKHIAKIEDLVSVVPNLQQTAGVGEGDVNFSLRGVSLLLVAPNQQGPVALYQDGVYVGGVALQGVSLFDLDRVEVVAGPQGTLYGKNATGGAINLISKVPGHDTEGYIKIGAGNYNERELAGAFQVGLTDTLAARLAFTGARADGWFQNVYPGQANASSTRYYGVRGTLAWTPSDALNVTLRLEKSLSNPTQYGTYAVGRTPAQVPGTCFGFGSGVGCGFFAPPYFRSGLGPYQYSSNYEPNYDHSADGASVTVDWKLAESLTVTSISSFNEGKISAPSDFDGTPLQLFEVPVTGATMRQWAEDLRVASYFKGPFNYLAGVYYNREVADPVQVSYLYSQIGGDTCNLAEFAGCLANSIFTQIKQTEAAYADGSFDLTSSLTLRGGIRFTHDAGSVEHYTGGYYNISPVTPVAVGIDDLSAAYSTNKVTGRLGLDYKLAPSEMIYVTYNSSFRGATFNQIAVDGPLEIQPAPPEQVRGFEVGMKTEWFDRRATLNAALFAYNYTNQQTFQSSNGLILLYSIPKSTLKGGELSFNLHPVARFRVNGAVGYTDAIIQSGTLNGIDIRGKRVPLASKITGNLGVDCDVIQNAIGTFTIGIDGNYTSRVFYDAFNTERISQPGYTLLNGHIAFKSHDEHILVTLWGRNLTNRFYTTSAFDNTGAFGFDSFALGPPRMYGGSFEYKF